VLVLACDAQYVRLRPARRLGAGCDVELPRLGEARTRGALAVVAAAGEALPFQTGSLDVVVLNEVIEHVHDDRATMREVGRVLSPGGTCIIFSHNQLITFETHGF
jgi:SAM-dependent methyltransferase